jgi:hypothetical protein
MSSRRSFARDVVRVLLRRPSGGVPDATTNKAGRTGATHPARSRVGFAEFGSAVGTSLTRLTCAECAHCICQITNFNNFAAVHFGISSSRFFQVCTDERARMPSRNRLAVALTFKQFSSAIFLRISPIQNFEPCAVFSFRDVRPKFVFRNDAFQIQFAGAKSRGKPPIYKY